MSRAPCTTIAAGAPGLAAGWPMLAVAAILILAALGAYSNSFKVSFLLDDSSSISDNSSIRQLGRIGDVLSPPATGTTAARPLLNLSFALNYAVSGLSVPGYHAVNLLIHICAGLALLGIVRRTLLSPGLRHRYGEAALPLAAFAALLWTLHPLQTEAVTYISQRAESLMGLFYLLTLYCFIRADVGRGRPTKICDQRKQSVALSFGGRLLLWHGHQASHGYRARARAALRPGVRQWIISIRSGEPPLVLRESCRHLVAAGGFDAPYVSDCGSRWFSYECQLADLCAV